MPQALNPVISVPQDSQGSHLRFRPDIEGLRAIAVLAVALWHAQIPGVQGGFTGVDVFFVVSGYLITGLLVAEYESSATINFSGFYARRARRLLPAAAFMIVSVLLVSAFVLAPQELEGAARAGRAAAVYLSNVWLSLDGESYFAQTGASNPFVHTWSLAVEEQFYLAWPVVMLFALRVGKSRKRAAAILAVFGFVSLVACLVLSYKRPLMGFFQSPARAWQFAVGGLGVLSASQISKLSERNRAVLGSAGLAGIVSCIVFTSYSHYPGWRALYPTFATALVLVCGGPSFLGSAPFRWLGGLSYSWYLWHWPVLSLAGALVRPLTVYDRVAAVGAALLLAVVTRSIVENPIRFSRLLSRRPALSLAMAAAVTVLGFWAGSAVRNYSGQLAKDSRLAPLVAASHDLASPPRACLPPTLSARLLTCSMGVPGGNRRIVLFGDSHAMQWFVPIERAAKANGWEVTPLARSGCPSIDARRDTSISEDICVAWREQALTWIAAHPPDLVVMTNSAPIGGATTPFLLDQAASLYRRGLRKTLLRLAKNNQRVLLIRDSPHQYFNIPACLVRSVRTGFFPPEDCRMPAREALNPRFFEADQEAAAGLANVRLLDLSEEYCPGTYCDVQRGDMVLYRDHTHFTARYALTLASRIAIELAPSQP